MFSMVATPSMPPPGPRSIFVSGTIVDFVVEVTGVDGDASAVFSFSCLVAFSDNLSFVTVIFVFFKTTFVFASPATFVAVVPLVVDTFALTVVVFPISFFPSYFVVVVFH